MFVVKSSHDHGCQISWVLKKSTEEESIAIVIITYIFTPGSSGDAFGRESSPLLSLVNKLLMLPAPASVMQNF